MAADLDVADVQSFHKVPEIPFCSGAWRTIEDDGLKLAGSVAMEKRGCPVVAHVSGSHNPFALVDDSFQTVPRAGCGRAAGADVVQEPCGKSVLADLVREIVQI